MLQIMEDGRKVVYLEEGEEIVIRTLNKNKVKVVVACKGHALFVDDVLEKKIKDIREEEQELKKLKSYNQIKK